jgi:lipopolysaccharide export LptBFGC system permease protein LptF
MAKLLKVGNEPKESREAKRLRKAHMEQARDLSRKYVFPLIVLLFCLIAAFFFFKYGFGYAKIDHQEANL